MPFLNCRLDIYTKCLMAERPLARTDGCISESRYSASSQVVLNFNHSAQGGSFIIHPALVAGAFAIPHAPCIKTTRIRFEKPMALK